MLHRAVAVQKTTGQGISRNMRGVGTAQGALSGCVASLVLLLSVTTPAEAFSPSFFGHGATRHDNHFGRTRPSLSSLQMVQGPPPAKPFVVRSGAVPLTYL